MEQEGLKMATDKHMWDDYEGRCLLQVKEVEE